MKLWKKHGTQPRFARIPEDFETAGQQRRRAGRIARYASRPGSRHGDEVGASYFIAQFSFGDLSQQEVLHSAGIFAREVIPAARERVTASA